MAAVNRTDKIKNLLKLLQKRYKHPYKPVAKNVLDTLIFAACLENASFDAAESAFSVLEHHYIDWNEIRVCTPQELADTLPMLPTPLTAAERIKRTLQWIFETTYMFDLEEQKKKNIGQASDYFESIPFCTQFMKNYTIQVGLGGHVIPLDEAALRIFRRLDMAKVAKSGDYEEVSGLERTIPKAQGVEFALQLHTLGVEFFNDPDSQALLNLLKTIDPAAEKRSWDPPPIEVKKPIPKLPTYTPPPVKKFASDLLLDEDDDDFENPDAIVEGTEESVEFIGEEIILPNVPVIEKTPVDVASEKPSSKKAVKPRTPKPPQDREEPEVTTKPKKKSQEKEASKKTTVKKKTISSDKSKEKPVVTKKSTPQKPAKKADVKKSTKKSESKSPKSTPAKKGTTSKKKISKKTPAPKKEVKTVKKKEQNNYSRSKKLQQKKPR